MSSDIEAHLIIIPVKNGFILREEIYPVNQGYDMSANPRWVFNNAKDLGDFIGDHLSAKQKEQKND